MKRGFLKKPTKTKAPDAPTTPSRAVGPVFNLTSDEIAAALARFHLTLGDNDNTAATTSDPYQAYVESIPIIAKFPKMTSTTGSNEPVTTALLHKVTEKALLNSPTFLKAPWTLPPPSSSEWPCISKVSPGEGKGVFARRDIPLGQLILNERSLVIVPVTIVYSFGRKDLVHPDKLQQMLIDTLDDESRKEFYSLHNCQGELIAQIRGILDTNMHDIGPLPGPFKGRYGALGITMSRFNHSCCPNARYFYDPNMLSMRVVAINPIKKGEQILISYVDALLPRKERQSKLRMQYAFNCGCTCCRLPPQKSLRSDTLRVFLGSAMKEIEDGTFERESGRKSYWKDLLTDDRARKTSQRVIDALDEEGLINWKMRLALGHLMQLCMSCCVLGDREGAAKWGRRGSEVMGAAKVELPKNALGGAMVGIWKDFVERPEKMGYWDLRSSWRAKS